jgi:hypothetical protein
LTPAAERFSSSTSICDWAAMLRSECHASNFHFVS